MQLNKARVVIYGLGLMGGSLAIALQGNCAKITAVDPDEKTRGMAIAHHIVEKALPYPPEHPLESDLIILAAPTITNINILQNLSTYQTGNAVVLDLSSTKSVICSVMETLPAQFDPIGGHPMCGKESYSLENADPAIYRGATFALSPLLRTSPAARSLAAEIVEIVGSELLWIDAKTHDRLVAFSSHLPYLVSNALAATVPAESAILVGTGFISTSRLAVSNQTMILDVLETNRENILSALHSYQENLAELEKLLSTESFQELGIHLQKGAEQRQILVGK
jgi:prephenate dehydrogenase